MNLNALTPELLTFLIFLSGIIGLVVINIHYSKNLHKPPSQPQIPGYPQTEQTSANAFMSHHFMTFFILPFTILVLACLAILGKLDPALVAIISVIIAFIIQKINIH